jgi:hypothetical protein
VNNPARKLVHDAARKASLATACLSVALTCAPGTLRADQTPTNFFDSVSGQPIAGLPSGPYRSWSDEQKSAARQLIRTGCFRLTMAGNERLDRDDSPTQSMSLAQQNAVRRLLTEESQTIALTCIAMHLPKDHPERPKLEERALAHYAAAKALGTKFPPPTFGE